MNNKILISLLATMMLLFTCTSNAGAQTQAKSTNAGQTIQVIQFHSEHRCQTCLKIEDLARQTIKDYSNLAFTLVNVDDKQNEKQAEQFQATGTALFLYNPKTGKKKDLTDFAFMNASDSDKFIREFKKEIAAFIKP